jgi:hypothetical protein
MGDAIKRRVTLDGMVAASRRCIYCDAIPTTVEHMPPKIMFNGKARPKGMEFAACEPCNNKTSTADLVAAFYSRIGNGDLSTNAELAEFKNVYGALMRKAPGVAFELAGAMRERWVPSKGLLVRKFTGDVSGCRDHQARRHGTNRPGRLDHSARGID